jgi:hypothetical protein
MNGTELNGTAHNGTTMNGTSALHGTTEWSVDAVAAPTVNTTAPVPTVPTTVVSPTLPVSEPAPAGPNGLTKRVRGAQLPDLGVVAEPDPSYERPAEQVRNTLASLQRGTERSRQDLAE